MNNNKLQFKSLMINEPESGNSDLNIAVSNVYVSNTNSQKSLNESPEPFANFEKSLAMPIENA
jgi:hypothetical protein